MLARTESDNDSPWDRIIRKNGKSSEEVKDKVEAPDYETERRDYASYLELANAPWKPFGDNILTFEEFIEVNYSDTIIYDADSKDHPLKFLPAVTTNAGYAFDMLTDSFSRMNPEQKVAAAKAVRTVWSRAMNTAQRMSQGDKFMDIVSDGGSGGGGSSDGLPTSTFSSHNLNINLKPTEVKLNTGIYPNCYSVYYQYADSTHAPLHLTQVKLDINSLNPTTSPSLYLFWNNVLSFILQTSAQRSVSFNIANDTSISTSSLTAYFNNLLNALQVYYFYASVISFTDNYKNKNQGMYSLRSMISSSDLDLLYQLKRLLQSMPIPPNMNHLVFWMNQTYRESSLPGAALIKIMPFPFDTSTNTVNNNFTQYSVSYLTNSVINSITTSSIRATASMLARVSPSWIMEDLLAPSDNALHDPGYVTLWTNLPNTSSSTSGVMNYAPYAADSTQSITYNAHTNEFDGAIFGLTNIYNNGTAQFESNMLVTTIRSAYGTSGSRSTNRISYTANGFVPAVMSDDLAISRNETYLLPASATSGINFQRFGTEPVLNVNVSSVRETAFKLFEWMLSLPSIGNGNRYGGVDGSRRNSSSSGSNSDKPKFKYKKRSRSKGKSRDADESKS